MANGQLIRHLRKGGYVLAPCERRGAVHAPGSNHGTTMEAWEGDIKSIAKEGGGGGVSSIVLEDKHHTQV